MSAISAGSRAVGAYLYITSWWVFTNQTHSRTSAWRTLLNSTHSHALLTGLQRLSVHAVTF